MTIIENNKITDAEGAGVRLGGGTIDGVTYGLNSQVISPIQIPSSLYEPTLYLLTQG